MCRLYEVGLLKDEDDDQVSEGERLDQPRLSVTASIVTSCLYQARPVSRVNLNQTCSSFMDAVIETLDRTEFQMDIYKYMYIYIYIYMSRLPSLQ